MMRGVSISLDETAEYSRYEVAAMARLSQPRVYEIETSALRKLRWAPDRRPLRPRGRRQGGRA